MELQIKNKETPLSTILQNEKPLSSSDLRELCKLLEKAAIAAHEKELKSAVGGRSS